MKSLANMAALVLLLTISLVPTASDAQRRTGSAACVAARAELGEDGSSLSVQPLITSIWQSMVGEQIVSANIALISCNFFRGKVEALRVGGASYIVYNPDWVREVLSANRTEAQFVFGHEIGHFAANHFGTTRLSRRQMELEADELAGYYVARLGGSRRGVNAILARIRYEQNEEYPSRAESLGAAMRGFDRGAERGLRRNQLISAMRNQASVTIRGTPPRDPEQYRDFIQENERACREGGNNRLTNMPPMCAAPTMGR